MIHLSLRIYYLPVSIWHDWWKRRPACDTAYMMIISWSEIVDRGSDMRARWLTESNVNTIVCCRVRDVFGAFLDVFIEKEAYLLKVGSCCCRRVLLWLSMENHCSKERSRWSFVYLLLPLSKIYDCHRQPYDLMQSRCTSQYIVTIRALLNRGIENARKLKTSKKENINTKNLKKDQIYRQIQQVEIQLKMIWFQLCVIY